MRAKLPVGYWRIADGTMIRCDEMEESHLINALRAIKRRTVNQNRNLLDLWNDRAWMNLVREWNRRHPEYVSMTPGDWLVALQEGEDRDNARRARRYRTPHVAPDLMPPDEYFQRTYTTNRVNGGAWAEPVQTELPQEPVEAPDNNSEPVRRIKLPKRD